MFLCVVLVAIGAGGIAYAASPPSKNVWTGPHPSAEDLESAKSSVSQAQFLFGLMSGVVKSGTSGIDQIASSATSVFDAVDSAKTGADQAVTALNTVPSLAAAGTQVAQLTGAAGTAIGQLTTLTTIAAQFDQVVGPLTQTLEHTNAPGTADALKQLKSMQQAAHALGSQTNSVTALQGSLNNLTSAVKPTATVADSSVASVKSAATQLRDGLATLAKARGDSLAAANGVTQGLKQLTGVLDTINRSLDNAANKLGAGDGENGSTGHNVALAMIWAAGAGLLTMVLFLAVPWVRNRRSRVGAGGAPADVTESDVVDESPGPRHRSPDSDDDLP